MPFLNSLKLYGIRDPKTQIEAPLLKSVDLGAIRAVDFCRLFASSTASLTNLSLLREVRGSVAEIRSLLEHCPNLQFCNLSCDFLGLSPLALSPETINVLLPSLLQLSIHFWNFEAAENLLKTINAPSLRTLSLLARFLSPFFLSAPSWASNFPQLQNLKFSYISMKPQFLQEILPQFPNLERLDLQNSCAFEGLIRFYSNTVEENGDSTIQQIQRSSLRTLCVLEYYPMSVPSELKLLLTKMIKAGIQFGKLRTLDLKLDKFFREEELLELRCAVEEMGIQGMSFNLGC
jgi:hypothetical protein